MIVLQNLNKTFVLNGARKVVARDLNIVFPSGCRWHFWGATGPASRPCCG